VGQTLARLELQVVVASWVAAAEWRPGQVLEQMMMAKQKEQQMQQQRPWPVPRELELLELWAGRQLLWLVFRW